jgi:hypothetical protein
MSQINLGSMTINMGDSITIGEQFLFQSLAAHNRIAVSSRYYRSSFTSNYLALTGFLRGDLDQMKKYLPPQEHMIIGKVSPLTIAFTSATRALLAAVNGDLDIAEQLARRSLDFPSNFIVIFPAHWALAMVYLDRGNLAEASQQLSIAYRLPRIKAYPGVMTRSLPVAALILAHSNQPKRAAQILSLAYNHPASQIGWQRLWKTGAGLRTELEQTLGAAAFEDAWVQGKSLDLAETFTGLASELSGDIMVPAP